MRYILATLVVLAFSVNACSEETPIRANLGSGNEPNPEPVSENESYFIEVRGDQFSVSGDDSASIWTNVIAEIAPDRMIYSRRYLVKLGDGQVVEKAIEMLDRKQLSESEYQQLTKRLEAYRSANDEPLTPIDCPIFIGDGPSRAFVSTGETFWENDSGFIYPHGCESVSGNIIKKDLNNVLASLPKLNGLSGSRIE